MKTTTDVTNKNIEATNHNLKSLDEKMNAFKLDNDEKTKTSQDRFEAMEKRLALIEAGADRMESQIRNKNKLKNLQKTLDAQPTRRTKPKEKQVERIITQSESQPLTDKSTEGAFLSTWAQEVELQDQLERNGPARMERELIDAERLESENRQKIARERVDKRRNEATADQRLGIGEKEIENSSSIRMEIKLKDDNMKKAGMRKLKRWIGEETENSDSDTETDSSEDPTSWNHISRREKNRQKTRQTKKNRALKAAQHARKASHILGIYPISDRH